MNVFVFTWNTQSTQIDYDSIFVHALIEKIRESACDIVIIGLQEDSIRDSKLIGDDINLIRNEIHDEYSLLETVTLSGWGITTYKALVENWEYLPRGLRLAIFKKKESSVDVYAVIPKIMICPGLKEWFTCGKGGVAITLNTNFGLITVLNMHLPFSSSSLHGNRYPALSWQANCFKQLCNEANVFASDYFILLGDLNFRVQLGNDTASSIGKKLFIEEGYIQTLLGERDELRVLQSYAVMDPPFLEGINDSGPQFLPTCKLRHGRGSISSEGEHVYKYGKKDQRAPSWCDRILHRGFECTYYDRWDHSDMNNSDHASVIGIYTLNASVQCDD